MKLKIYGREGCPYCVKAKDLAKKLKDFGFVEDYEYIDFQKAGIPRNQVEREIGREIKTVPVVILDGVFIGGFSDLNARFPI